MRTDDFMKIFMATQDELKDLLYGKLVGIYGEENVYNKNGYLYAKGSHPVLLVAHLDTVHKLPPRNIFVNLKKTQIMAREGIGGDDRCGVVIILDIIKDLKCSVVFCEDEEIGGVGAGLFCKDKYELGVNYAVEFDRKGSNDYVFYKDFNPDFEEHIKKFGFKKAIGSYSDISDIALAYEIEAVNLSSGYYEPHTKQEYVDLEDMESIIDRATKMIATETPKFEFVEDSPYYGNHSYYDYGYYEYYDRPHRTIFTTTTPIKKITYNPLLIQGDQVILKINGVPKKFGRLFIDKNETIYDIKYKKKDIVLNAGDKVELYKKDKWAGEEFRTGYWQLRGFYPNQEVIPKEDKIKPVYECYCCGREIEEDDWRGIETKMCKYCRQSYFDEEEYI